MDTLLYSAPLLAGEDSLEHDGFLNPALEHEDESSSGYESSDESEVEYDVTQVTRVDHVHDSRRQMPVKFQRIRDLSNDLQLMIDMPELCDVTFLVGPDGVPVHGVRAILATRSRVFYQLLLKHVQIRQTLSRAASKQGIVTGRTDRLTVPVRKYDPEVFRTIMQFVHSGSAAIIDNNVVGLLCGAVQFQLPDLQCACWNYISGCLVTTTCGENLLESARLYSKHHKIALDVMDKVYSAIDNRRYETGRLESTV